MRELNQGAEQSDAAVEKYMLDFAHKPREEMPRSGVQEYTAPPRDNVLFKAGYLSAGDKYTTRSSSGGRLPVPAVPAVRPPPPAGPTPTPYGPS